MRTTGSCVMEAGSIARPAGVGPSRAWDPCGRGPLPARLLLLGLFLQESLHDQENDRGDDDEIDEGSDEVADRELDVSDLDDRFAPVSLRRERADDRHDE